MFGEPMLASKLITVISCGVLFKAWYYLHQSGVCTISPLFALLKIDTPPICWLLVMKSLTTVRWYYGHIFSPVDVIHTLGEELLAQLCMCGLLLHWFPAEYPVGIAVARHPWQLVCSWDHPVGTCWRPCGNSGCLPPSQRRPSPTGSLGH